MHRSRPFACLFAGLLGVAAAAAEPEPPPALEGVCACADTLKPLADADPEVNKLLAAYNFPAEPFAWRLEPRGRTARYAVHHLTFPSPVTTPVAESNTVHGEYYVPRPARGAGPAALVLHILDGRFLVARAVCRYFAGQGTPALLVMMPYYGPRRPKGRSLAGYYREDPRRILDALRATALECRRAACWLQTRPEVAPDRIGVVGVSLGAIAGALAVGVDPRFTRNVLVLGGGDPAAILWHAPETAVVRAALVELGYSRERVQALAAGVDPIRFAGRVDPKTTLMINALADKTVPRDCTVRLWKAMGRPPIEWLLSGHYSAILYIPAILPTAHHFVVHGRRPEPAARP